MMKRRSFLKTSILTGAGMAIPGLPSLASTVDARVEIMLDEPIGTISPNLYGQFTEHIGGVIYDGVWVGKQSKIRNHHGIRAELIDRMKRIQVPVIRWPGGCFADSYDWKDGIGAPEKRPRRTNFWETDRDAARLHEKGAQIFEPNAFGTDEFLQFCKLVGAEPYLAANLRSLPALELDRWVEYCNSPSGSTTLADMRAANGYPQPYGVKYWGVGNESWGCGGNFTPQQYASEFRRYTSWIPEYGVDLQFIGSGPSGNDINWTHRFFEQLYGEQEYDNPRFTGWSVHHYASNLSRGKTADWYLGKGDALQFDPVDWYELLRECDRVGSIIQDQWAAMGEYDKEHRVKLVVDEYGPWYRQGTELDPTHLFGQQITVRDAVATALTLDTFNRNADKVSMATCAQLVNNLNALFLCHEDRFFATPNYYVFEMYAAHQGGQSIRAEFSGTEVRYERDGKTATFWGLNGSASRKANAVTLSVVNPDLRSEKQTQVIIRGAKISSACGRVLASDDMHAHNTFDRPDKVRSVALDASVGRGVVSVTLPAASIVKLEMTLV